MKILKNVLPWLVALGIFFYLFHKYDPKEIWASLQVVILPIFIPFTILYFIIIYFADIFSLSKVLHRFGYTVTVMELVPVRGVTYLLMVLNYTAGQGAFAYYLKKTHKIPIFEALSIFFFIALVDLFWIISLAFAGSFFQSYEIGGNPLSTFVQFFAVSAFFLFFLGHHFWNRPWKIAKWLRSKSIFKTFAEASIKDYLWTAMLRTPIHCSIILAFYILISTFNAHIPFVQVLGNMPLVFLVGVLPITPGGLGTTNAAMIALLSPHITGAYFATSTFTPSQLVLAASLLWMFMNYLLKILSGMFFMNKVSKDVFRGNPIQTPNIQTIDNIIP